MPTVPATWTVDALRDRLVGTRFADVRLFDEIDSTNRYLLDEAGAGAPEGVVAVADHQSAGRGRLGRRWESQPGASLLVSVLLRPTSRPLRWSPERLHLVTAACAMAVCDAVEQVAGFRPGLKWPNDLVVEDRKLAGVLAESRVVAVGIDALVVGLGLNVAQESFPPELAEIATSCRQVSGRAFDRADLLVAFLVALDRRYTQLGQPSGPADTLHEYRNLCVTVGRAVRVDFADRSIEGVAVEINDDGHLVVETSPGTCTVVTAADVVHLRAQPAQ